MRRATKRQFQSLAGRLSWAAGVVRGGRVFLRRVFDKISTLKHASHRSIIDSNVRADLIWWHEFLSSFNGRSVLLDKKPIECVFWLSASYNFHLTSRFIRGIFNIAADSASRLHQPGHMERLLPFTGFTPISLHMSSKSLQFLLNRFPDWKG